MNDARHWLMCEEMKRYLWVATQCQSAHVCVEFCADCFSYGEDGLPVGGSSRAPRCSRGHVGHRWACVGVSMRIRVGGLGDWPLVRLKTERRRTPCKIRRQKPRRCVENSRGAVWRSVISGMDWLRSHSGNRPRQQRPIKRHPLGGNRCMQA